MTLPWWSGLPAVELRHDCGGATHRVVWANGELHAPDHPDADRERTLSALGADPFPCLDLFDAWQRHTDDLEVLILASRGPSDTIPIADDEEGDGFTGHVGYRGRYLSISTAGSARARKSGWTMYSPQQSHDHDEVDHAPLGVTDLLQLGYGLPERLVATVIATWAERVEAAADERAVAARAQLQAALYGRLLATVRDWTGARTSLDLVMTAPDDGPPQLSREGDHVVVRLPFSWLRDVWAKGLATVLGQLCLAAEQSGEDKWQLLTASGGETITLTEWQLSRSAGPADHPVASPR